MNPTINSNSSQSNRNVVLRDSMYAVVLGLIIVATAWVLDIVLRNMPFTLQSWVNVHNQNPLLFLFDLLPIVLGLLVYYISKRNDNTVKLLQNTVGERNQIIEKNATFAQQIGERNFDFDIQITENDTLGQSLLLMRNNLLETNKKEQEQNWIAHGKEIISNILRQYNNIDTLAYETLVRLIKYIGAIQGAFYIYDEERKIIRNVATHAYNRKKYVNQEFKVGQGLIGQAAYEMDTVYRKEIPSDYITISSGLLGDKKPSSILIVPLISDEKLQGIIEFASLENEISEITIKFVKELSEIIGQTVFNLKVNTRTEKLLKEAQELTEELKQNQEELRKNAIEMKLTQEELERTNKTLEKQIAEVENAQRRLHSLLENASEVISIYDYRGYVKYESPSVKNILGILPEDIIGKNAFETIHTEDDDPTREIFKQLLEHPNESQTFEFQYRKSKDEVLWLETTGRNFLNNTAIEGIIFNTRDITVRKIAEQAQRMSGQMQALSENSPDMIVRLNVEGKLFYVNPMFHRYTGLAPKDVITKNITDINLNEQIQELFNKVLIFVSSNEQNYEAEFEFPTTDGLRIMQLNAIPEYDDNRHIETILLVAHDITERKKIEQIIKDKNKSINDSINYAKRIQTAILPDNRQMRDYLPNSFMFYKPRDIVSGDFPWFFTKDDDVYIAAVDCTGHGVPGAMLAFVGYFLLNNIVDHDVDQTAGEILDRLHQEVRRTLRQDREDANARDGMDIAFCKIRKKHNELQYAGAHRPLYYLTDGQLVEYEGNKKAIGGIPNKKKQELNFVNHTIKYKAGDKIFFFSDGLPDQIGGPEGRKYQVTRIRDVILQNHDNSMTKFSRLFVHDFNKWKQDLKQIDDVLLIGIEF